MTIRLVNDWPLCGLIELTTAWHQWGFCWHLEVQQWSVRRNTLLLGPMQFYHVDLGKLAAMEAALEMKWAARYG